MLKCGCDGTRERSSNASGLVRLEFQYPAAIITLTCPQTHNALSIPMVAALDAAIERADKDPRARAIIFTAEGPAFCAGMDLHELLRALGSDADGAWKGALAGEQLIDRVYRLCTPTIAALNGAAAGGGAGLLSACDMAVAAPEAPIGYPEMKVGIQSAMVLLHLMRLVGERQARYLALTGELPTRANLTVLAALVFAMALFFSRNGTDLGFQTFAEVWNQPLEVGAVISLVARDHDFECVQRVARLLQFFVFASFHGYLFGAISTGRSLSA